MPFSRAAVDSVVAQTGPIGEPATSGETSSPDEGVAEGAAADPLAEPGPPDSTADIALAILLSGAAVAAFVSLRRRGVLRKDAFTELRRDPTILPPPHWFVAAGGLFLIGPIAAALGAGLAGIDFSNETPTLREVAIPQLAAYAAALAVVIPILLALGRRAPAAGFRAKVSDLFLAPAAFLLAFPLVYVAGLLSSLVDWAIRWIGSLPEPDPLAHETLRMLREHPGDPWAWVVIGVVIIGAPVVEEFLYRGFLQTGFLRLTRSGWLSILITSVLFALTHAEIADPRALPGLFVLSVAMGVAFEKTGRISIPIGMHALFNALNVAVAAASG